MSSFSQCHFLSSLYFRCSLSLCVLVQRIINSNLFLPKKKNPFVVPKRKRGLRANKSDLPKFGGVVGRGTLSAFRRQLLAQLVYPATGDFLQAESKYKRKWAILQLLFFRRRQVRRDNKHSQKCWNSKKRGKDFGPLFFVSLLCSTDCTVYNKILLLLFPFSCCYCHGQWDFSGGGGEHNNKCGRGGTADCIYLWHLSRARRKEFKK